MKKISLSILIFTLLLFTFYSTVNAATVPTFTEEMATDILNYTKENICLSQTGYGYFDENNIPEIKNFIDTFDVSIFTSKLNTQLQTRINSKLNSDDIIEFNNISLIPYCNYSGSNNFSVGWYFVISKSINPNNTTNSKLGYAYLKKYSQNDSSVLTTIYNSNNENIYVFDYTIATYSSANDFSSRIFNYGNENNWATAVNGTSSKPIPDAEIDGNKIFMPFYYSLTENQQLYVNLYDFNNPTLYTNLNYYGSSNSSGENPSGDNGTYYNYDYNEYFIRPYIKIETINGLTQYLADSYTIPFSVYSQSGDEYYPFDSLKMDLRVLKSVTDYSGENLETHFVSMVDSYKRFSGNFADTTGYSDFITNGNILRYNYDLKDKFDSNFVNQYLNDATNKEQYAFQLVLYDFWGDVLSMSDVFYFYDANNLNNKPLIDNWGGDNTINSSFDSTNTSDFSSLVKTFTDFMSTIMSFWSFLPGWLIALLTLGVTSAIAIRILGR